MYGFVRILFFFVRYMNFKVVYLTTKLIQIKPYTICISHQLGYEVERPERSTTFSVFAFLHEKRNIFSFYAIFFRLLTLTLSFLPMKAIVRYCKFGNLQGFYYPHVMVKSLCHLLMKINHVIVANCYVANMSLNAVHENF